MRRIVLITIAILTYVFSHEMLMVVYPNAKTNYSDFLDYYYMKEIVNEFLTTLLFFILFMYVKNRLFSALCVFGFTLALSSFLDKSLFSNYSYLFTDIAVIAVATVLSIKVYNNGESPSGDKRINS